MAAAASRAPVHVVYAPLLGNPFETDLHDVGMGEGLVRGMASINGYRGEYRLAQIIRVEELRRADDSPGGRSGREKRGRSR